jgi:CheY-like chemotaxis protein
VESPRRIIILDDSEIIREMIAMELEAHGYEVTALDSPFELSRALGEKKPQLALIDVSMPGLEGDKVVSVVLQYRLHRCPLVLFSSRSDEELTRLVKQCGAAGYIKKTDDPAKLLEAIERFIDAAAAATPV